MANIAIADLRPAGSQLFFDGEGFMNDLSDELVGEIIGGISPTIVITIEITVGAFYVSVKIGYDSNKKPKPCPCCN